MNRKNTVLRDLENKKCLKLISGINNFDRNKVIKLVKAAEYTAATCIDICADENIIHEALEHLDQTALVVSSVKVDELIRAEELGADVLELGNFEALHEEGVYPSADEVFTWAQDLMARRTDALVSVTVPGHLSVKEQCELALKLEELGVEILQTEGASLSEATSAAALGQIEKVSLTLANTIEIAKTVEKVHIITASGLSPDTVNLAVAAGAHGIGVGKYVNKLESEIEILSSIKALQEALSSKKVASLV